MDCEPEISSSYSPSECLLSAVLSEKENIVESLLSRGDDVNMKGMYGETPLHIAAKNGYLDIVKILIQHGANINDFTLSSYRFVCSDDSLYCRYPQTVKNDDIMSVRDYTPLHLATLNRNMTVIKYLLENGANIDFEDKDGKTALFIAVEHDYCKIVDLLLLHDPDVNNNSNKEVLEMAVFSRNDNLRMIQHLYEYGFRINIDCDNSIKLISRVIEKRVIQVLEDLITQGANINFKDTKNGGFSPLHLAVVYKNEKICEILVKNKADVNVKDNRGNSPIFYAIENGDIKISKLLLNNGAYFGNDTVKAFNFAIENNYSQIIELILQHDENFNVNLPDNDGITPLHCIASHGNNLKLKETIMKLLLMKGVDVNCRSVKGITPLYAAAKKGFHGIVKILLECNVDVNALGNDGSCALHAAASGGHLQIVELLLKNNCNINIKNESGSTPLHTAVKNKHIKVCKTFIKNKAEIKAEDNRGNSPVYYAIENGDVNISELLLKNGANLGGNTIKAFNTAVENNYLHIIELILQQDENFNLSDSGGRTPLGCIVSCGNNSSLKEKITKLLLTKVADVNCRSMKVTTPLYAAIKNGFNGIEKILLECNVDVNTLENDGSCALHAATIRGHLEIVELLLKRKCNINIKNESGCTPLYIAVENNHIKICELLLKSGADYGLKYSNGNTVLHLACEKGYEEMVKVILETVCYNIFKNCCLSIDSFDNFCKRGLMVISTKFYDFINAINDDSLTCLMIGVKSNSSNIVKVLLNFGADVHSLTHHDDDEGVDRSALHVAADLGNYDLFPALFEFGADINTIPDLCSVFESALHCLNHYSGNDMCDICDIRICICVDMILDQATKFYLAELYHFCSRFFYKYDELYYGFDFEEELGFFIKPCREELSAMKNTFVLKDVSFHDILKTTNITEFLLPARTKEFFDSFYSFDHEKMFPIYSDVLSFLFRLIVLRNSLFLECIMWLESTSSIFSNIPSICIEKILAELSNKSLINLMEACRPIY